VQLNLFHKSKRPRRAKPPTPLEFASHVVLADILRRWINPGWRFTHIPNGEHRAHQVNPKTGKRYSLTGQRLQRMGLVPGWPDFMFAGPNRHVVWLELKRKKLGRMSNAQEDIGAHLTACGFDFLITNDVGEAVRWLQRLGVVRSTIEVQ
jgi:hypothetical protein